MSRLRLSNQGRVSPVGGLLAALRNFGVTLSTARAFVLSVFHGLILLVEAFQAFVITLEGTVVSLERGNLSLEVGRAPRRVLALLLFAGIAIVRPRPRLPFGSRRLWLSRLHHCVSSLVWFYFS